jgi:hypothetical protein
MASSALKWITTRAKQIYKKGGTWKTAIKKAGAEYRSGKKVSGTKKKRKPAKRRAAVRRVKKLHRAEGKAIKQLRGVRSTFAAAALGRVTTSQLISSAKEKIGMEIGRAEVSKFRAAKKSAKKKIAKRIAALKTRFRKLC